MEEVETFDGYLLRMGKIDYTEKPTKVYQQINKRDLKTAIGTIKDFFTDVIEIL